MYLRVNSNKGDILLLPPDGMARCGAVCPHRQGGRPFHLAAPMNPFADGGYLNDACFRRTRHEPEFEPAKKGHLEIGMKRLSPRKMLRALPGQAPFRQTGRPADGGIYNRGHA